jgi:hypothetical protein
LGVSSTITELEATKSRQFFATLDFS